VPFGSAEFALKDKAFSVQEFPGLRKVPRIFSKLDRTGKNDYNI
jgi:hypothetical protein